MATYNPKLRVCRNSPFYVRREAFQSKLFGKDIARKIISPTENFLAKVNLEKAILGRILQERVFLRQRKVITVSY